MCIASISDCPVPRATVLNETSLHVTWDEVTRLCQDTVHSKPAIGYQVIIRDNQNRPVCNKVSVSVREYFNYTHRSILTEIQQSGMKQGLLVYLHCRAKKLKLRKSSYWLFTLYDEDRKISVKKNHSDSFGFLISRLSGYCMFSED